MHNQGKIIDIDGETVEYDLKAPRGVRTPEILMLKKL